ncbi:MAG: tripartite tricarboxylate transporter substrate binding protein [Alphaproteobacteria bacterium]|nr:tripartite tricarboxylate transporter substrate binding protein [Alphaproteobacteria bacterium]
MRRMFVVAAAACAVAVVAAGSAKAQGQADNSPNNTVKIVVPTAPGGPLDVLGRLMTQRFRDVWGQAVIIENRPGGALMVGANAVAKSTPDGYTLLLTNDGPVTINPSLYRSMPYDPKKEFAPVTQVVDAPFVLVVNPDVPAKSVAELIALAKDKPGKINFASGGNTSKLAGELFRLSSGIEIVNVPYNGSGQAILGVVGGDVHMMIDGITSSLPHVQSGKLRALGVGTAKRLAEVPGVPTIAETLPGYIGSTWLGLFAPAGTPPHIVNKIQSTFAMLAREPELKERMIALGMYPVASTPAEFFQFLEKDTRQWERVICDAKIQRIE